MGFIATIRDLQERHQRFVKRVHSFRIPLSPTGRRIMTVVYFSIPIIGGLMIMDWAQNKAKVELGWEDNRGEGQARPDEQKQVLKAMKIDPSQRQDKSQIEAQNERLQSFLVHLKEKS